MTSFHISSSLLILWTTCSVGLAKASGSVGLGVHWAERRGIRWCSTDRAASCRPGTTMVKMPSSRTSCCVRRLTHLANQHFTHVIEISGGFRGRFVDNHSIPSLELNSHIIVDIPTLPKRILADHEGPRCFPYQARWRSGGASSCQKPSKDWEDPASLNTSSGPGLASP